MLHSNTNSNIVIAAAFISAIVLFFIGLVTTYRYQELIMIGYDTCFFIFLIGFILRKKNVQQLLGLFFYIIVFNLDLLNYNFFQIKNENILFLVRQYNFYLILLAFIFLIPTTFNKYKLSPLTNYSNFKDSTIIATTICITITFQIVIRIMY